MTLRRETPRSAGATAKQPCVGSTSRRALRVSAPTVPTVDTFHSPIGAPTTRPLSGLTVRPCSGPSKTPDAEGRHDPSSNLGQSTQHRPLRTRNTGYGARKEPRTKHCSLDYTPMKEKLTDSTDPRPTLEAYQTHDDALRLVDPELIEGWIEMWDPVDTRANR